MQLASITVSVMPLDATQVVFIAAVAAHREANVTQTVSVITMNSAGRIITATTGDR